METLVQDQYAIEIQDLSRVFRDEKKKKKDFLALDRLNLKVKEGEIFGLLGPNGAGKTTLIKILATLLLPSSGRVLVGGIDPVQDSFSVRRKISMVSGGEHSGYGVLTVREHLLMFSQFYGLPLKTARPRVDELIRAVGLEDKANAKINKLSTGLRQKMNFARGFVSDPEIIFLDEPTLGLDVGASRVVRSYVKDWARRGRRTVLLTTHYMAEAEEMCDRVAIIDQGKILACDTPGNLKSLLTKESVLRLEVSLSRFTGGRCASLALNAGMPLSE
ncbi:MAG: ABC transporter ATP-binding protein, partial [Firmicutes bacterium]|nr:ABC transporter ATP-binding protein [Bacillota bacterium]